MIEDFIKKVIFPTREYFLKNTKWNYVALGGCLGLCASFFKSAQQIPESKEEAVKLLSSLVMNSKIFSSSHFIDFIEAPEMLKNNNDILFWILLERNILRDVVLGFFLIPGIIFAYRGFLYSKQIVMNQLVLRGVVTPPIPTEFELELKQLRSDLAQAIQELNKKIENIQFFKKNKQAADKNAEAIARLIKLIKEKNLDMNEYLCPITREVMLYPVKTADGYYFEKCAIKLWYEKGNLKCILDPKKALIDPDSLQIDITLQLKIVSVLNSKLRSYGDNNTDSHHQKNSQRYVRI